MRQPLIVGNWKMHGAQAMAVELINALTVQVQEVSAIEWVVCPPFIYLDLLRQQLVNSVIRLGAQNVSDQPNGALTGEVSASMLCDIHCRYVIVGHSERRQYMNETNILIASKVKAALNAGLIPILCVGETLAEREAGQTLSVVQEQLAHVLSLKDNLPSLTSVVIAYEPIWAIGTGQTATPEEADAVHASIRQCCDMVLPGFGEQVRILYGGSVKPQNAQALLAMPNIDGALVGGAALNADQFIEIGKQWNKS
jgi:triosephosphate isomerase